MGWSAILPGTDSDQQFDGRDARWMGAWPKIAAMGKIAQDDQ
jgi:hypothetical protein